MIKKVLLSLAMSTMLLQAEALHVGAVKSLLDHAEKTVIQIDNTQLKKMIDNYEKFTLIDLRGNSQVERGEIYATNAIKIERGYLEFQIEKKVPDKNSKIVLYCCSGLRSILAAESLMKMGYTNVLSLKGGVIGWVDSGLALDTTFGEMIHKQE